MNDKNKLMIIMEEKNITYQQLSMLTGLSYSGLQKIATFQRTPTQDTMIAISKGLHMRVSDVFDLGE